MHWLSMSLDQSLEGVASLVAVLLFLTTSTIILRFVVRSMQKVSFGMDDWLMIPAWLGFAGSATVAIYGMVNRSIAFPAPSDETILTGIFVTFIRLIYIIDLLTTLALGFIRLSVLLFYRRIFITTTKWNTFGILSFTLIVIVVLWTLGFLLLCVFSCGTRFDLLISVEADRVCAVDSFFQGVAFSSFILDLLVVVLPIYKIWSLHATKIRRVNIVIIFLVPLAGTAASCTRMVVNAVYIDHRTAGIEQDPFLFGTRLLYYMILEVGLCQVAANLPFLWYFSKVTKSESAPRSTLSLMPINSARSFKNSNESSQEFYEANSVAELTREFQTTVEGGHQPTDDIRTGTIHRTR